ncbi:MAG TPA: type II secretion system protein [Candidatus Limnocylindria bacterium]|jgi:prepilin-type N-terminal cleavage/methylation domain-containing protein/prepilin-type processing-associated H-X9-DG protein|nr:type II secretion system protein [Candidatus Limnocylindria bacterium]
MPMSRRAFTLIELLLVMAVIAVLAGLLLPTLGGVTERGRSTACLSNLRQIGIGLRLYLDENGNRMPVMQNRSRNTNLVVTNAIYDVLGRQLGNPGVLHCPSDRQRYFEDIGSSYSWNFLLNGQRADMLRVMGRPVKENGIALFSDQVEFHSARGKGKGKNYLYADGAVKTFSAVELEPTPP